MIAYTLSKKGAEFPHPLFRHITVRNQFPLYCFRDIAIRGLASFATHFPQCFQDSGIAPYTKVELVIIFRIKARTVTRFMPILSAIGFAHRFTPMQISAIDLRIPAFRFLLSDYALSYTVFRAFHNPLCSPCFRQLRQQVLLSFTAGFKPCTLNAS